MHDGCSGSFTNGKQVVDKVRMMGFSDGLLPMPLTIKCECGTTFQMEYFEDDCPNCKMDYEQSEDIKLNHPDFEEKAEARVAYIKINTTINKMEDLKTFLDENEISYYRVAPIIP